MKHALKTMLGATAAITLGGAAYAQGVMVLPPEPAPAYPAHEAYPVYQAPLGAPLIDPADPSTTGSITTGTMSPSLESSGGVRNPSRPSIQQTEGSGNSSSSIGE